MSSVFDGLASLVDKSLLRQEEDLQGEPRFLMLETIREFGLEQLEDSGEAAQVRRRHAEHFLALAEQADPKLIGPEQGEWLARLEAEHDNLRAALAWGGSDDRGPGIPAAELGLRLAGALIWFWYYRGHLSEARRWTEPMLAASEGVPAPVRATLGAEAFAAASQVGRALPLMRVIDEALSPPEPPTPARAPTTPPTTGPAAGLTRREREVAVLIARGYTNGQIAHELVIAERTAETHVTAVFNKLGLRARAQVAAWAARHDLLPADSA